MGCCCAIIFQIGLHCTRLLCCPTQVLHVRNVQPSTSEEELRHLSAPYGRMVHCKVLRAKAQAFLEMEHVAAAQRLLMAAEADPERFKVQNKDSCQLVTWSTYSTHLERPCQALSLTCSALQLSEDQQPHPLGCQTSIRHCKAAFAPHS